MECKRSMSVEALSARSFLLRRLHSLTGVIPIGVFLLFHFFENASARRGAEAFNQTVVKISELPYLPVAEIFGLLLPILFHGIYGLFIRTPSRPNLVRYNLWRNWAYVLQRVTGVIAFAYIVFHVVTTRGWALFIKGDHITFADMQAMLQQPWVIWFYVLGIISVTFHFANGLWSFSLTWGLVRTYRAQQVLGLLTLGLFVALCIVGLDIISAFYYGTSVLSTIGL